MTGLQIYLILGGLVAAMTVALTVLVVGRPRLAGSKQRTDAVAPTRAQTMPQTQDTWLQLTHDAPAAPFTAEQAHREMQLHRYCRLDVCGRKAAAFGTLVRIGHITPDSTRLRA